MSHFSERSGVPIVDVITFANCPRCGSMPGHACETPEGRDVKRPHQDRFVLYHGLCIGAGIDPRTPGENFQAVEPAPEEPESPLFRI